MPNQLKPESIVPLPNAYEFPDHWFLDKQAPILKTRTHLPHWDQRHALQFITWSLGDALPMRVQDHIRRERNCWLRANPRPWTPEVEEEYKQRFIIRWEKWLDTGCGCCVLRRPNAQKLLSNALLYFQGKRVEVHAFVIMPNHVHLLMQVREESSLSKMMQSIKGFSSHEFNRVGLCNGKLWMKDYWDRVIRGPRHYARVWRYIERNPSRAGLKPEQFYLWQNRSINVDGDG